MWLYEILNEYGNKASAMENGKSTKKKPAMELFPQEIRENLDRILKEELNKVGAHVEKGRIVLKADVRDLMKNIAKEVNPKPVETVENFFARPEEIDPTRIEPVLEPVNTRVRANIFATAVSKWSVPVSAGYGRRMRYIVVDEYHGKVIGIVGLCDPVIGLKVRDSYIGWNKEQRIKRLYNLMTAYVLGAVEPYNTLLGAKLVALMVATKEVRQDFKEKYMGKETIIRQEKKIPELVAIDTMGAFGRTPIYNRLEGWKKVGYTKGYTHLMLTFGDFFKELVKVMRELGVIEKDDYVYGKGPNWRMRVLRKGLKMMGYNPDKLLHLEHKRAYYIRPLARNWREFLKCETNVVEPDAPSIYKVVEDWKRKWLPKGIRRWEATYGKE